VRRLPRRSPQGEGGPLAASYGSASQRLPKKIKLLLLKVSEIRR
jgi:hypothetical protein